MSQQPSVDPLMQSSAEFKRFLQTIEKKTLLEMISRADQEATAAWRSAHRRRKGATAGEMVGQYAGILEELVAFLKSAVVYRPTHLTQEVYNLFLQLRRDIH